MADSRILGQFEDYDFSHIAQVVLPRKFEQSHQYMAVQHVPLLPAIQQQIASAYILPPTRRWLGLSDPQSEALAGWYRRTAAHQIFLRAHRAAVAQHTVIGVLYPYGDKIGCQLLRPWQCEVDPHPLAHESLSSATEIRALWPVASTYDLTHYGILVMRQDKIYVRDGSGAERPVWGDSTANPFDGAYPAFALRLHPAPQGDFYSELPLDKLEAQIAITVAFTDAIYTASKAAWGLDVFQGLTQEQAAEMRGGPDVAVGLKRDETFEHVARGSHAKEYLSMVLDYLSTLASLAQVSPDKLTGWQRAITAVAKQVDYADRAELRASQRPSLEAMEGGFAAALLAVLRWRGDVNGYPPSVAVEVEYREPQWPADLLHYGQERALAYQAGRGSPVRDVMEHGATEEQALARVKQNRAWNQELGILAAPAATPGAIEGS